MRHSTDIISYQINSRVSWKQKKVITSNFGGFLKGTTLSVCEMPGLSAWHLVLLLLLFLLGLFFCKLLALGVQSFLGSREPPAVLGLQSPRWQPRKDMSYSRGIALCALQSMNPVWLPGGMNRKKRAKKKMKENDINLLWFRQPSNLCRKQTELPC